MTKTTKRRVWITLAIVALSGFILWLLLFERPTLMTPGFLKGTQSARHQNRYEEQLTSNEVNGQIRYARRTTVTESVDYFPEATFEDLVATAETEFTPARGWDLTAVPKDKVARFYQRTSNTIVSIYIRSNRVRTTISQTRFATPIDRFRNWWKSLRS